MGREWGKLRVESDKGRRELRVEGGKGIGVIKSGSW